MPITVRERTTETLRFTGTTYQFTDISVESIYWHFLKNRLSVSVKDRTNKISISHPFLFIVWKQFCHLWPNFKVISQTVWAGKHMDKQTDVPSALSKCYVVNKNILFIFGCTYIPQEKVITRWSGQGWVYQMWLLIWAASCWKALVREFGILSKKSEFFVSHGIPVWRRRGSYLDSHHAVSSRIRCAAICTICTVYDMDLLAGHRSYG